MALTQRIESLRKRHADIDQIVHDEEIRPSPDVIKLHELKRAKLTVKDELVRLLHSAEEAA